MGNNSQYSQTYSDPIHVNQYFMTSEVYDTAMETLNTDEEVGQFFQLLSTWAFENIIDVEFAKKCSPVVIAAVNTAIGTMFNGLNKYRWDVHNGSRGGRPRRAIPKIDL